jgi:hypothetical protein
MQPANRSPVHLDVLGLFLAGLSNTFLALLVAVLIHGPGTITTQADLLLRATWIAENTLLWKAGWFFWFVPTLTFCWSYYALGRHLNAKHPWRNLAIGLAIIAAAVDVVGVLINLIVLPQLAQEIIRTVSNPDPTLQVIFLSLEQLANTLTNIGGYGLYTVAGVLLLPALFATPDCPRWLKGLGVVEWSISSIAVCLLVVAPSLAAGPLVISFILFAPWVWGGAFWLWRRTSVPVALQV